MAGTRFAAVLGIALALVGTASAHDPTQEAPKKNWSNKTELGLTTTTGNSETLNVSFANEYKRLWTHSELIFDASALRNETTRVDRQAVGGQLVVTETDEVSAESYLLGAKYRHDITERLMWYVNGSWTRILQAGVDNRYRAGAGLGYAFIKGGAHTLVGELGGDYTDEEFVDGATDSFANARAFLGYDWAIGPSSALSSDLEGLQNLDESDDWRVNWISSITSSLSTRVALKVSYTVLYDNQPVVQVLDVGPPPVAFEFDKTDTILTASVVLNF
jgi:putative salt-induced outer membrane protein